MSGDKSQKTIITIMIIIIVLIAILTGIILFKVFNNPSSDKVNQVSDESVSDKYNTLLMEFFKDELGAYESSTVRGKVVKSDENDAPEFVVAQIIDQSKVPERLYLVAIHNEKVEPLVNYNYVEMNNDFEPVIYISPEDDSASVILPSSDNTEYLGTKFTFDNGEYITESETVSDIEDDTFKEAFIPDNYEEVVIDDLEDMGDVDTFIESFNPSVEPADTQDQESAVNEANINPQDDITYTISTIKEEQGDKEYTCDLVVFESKSGQYDKLNIINEDWEKKVLDTVSDSYDDHITHKINDVIITDEHIIILAGFSAYSDGAAHGYSFGTSAVYDINTGELTNLLDFTGFTIDEINRRVKDYLPETHPEIYDAFGDDYVEYITDENDSRLLTFYLDENEDIWIQNMMTPPASGGNAFSCKIGNFSEIKSGAGESEPVTDEIEIVTFVDEVLEENVINGTKFESHVILPKVMDSNDSFASINEHIEDYWNQVKEAMPGSGWYIDTKYYIYDNEDYNSLIVSSTTGQPFTGAISDNMVFVLDKNTHKVLTNDEVKEVSGVTEDRIQSVLQEYYDMSYPIDYDSLRLFFKENMAVWAYGFNENFGETEIEIP